MIQIKLPEVHSFQSALRSYYWLKKMKTWGPVFIVSGIILFPFVTIIGFGAMLIGANAIIHSSRNRQNLRDMIIKTWLNGNVEKFDKIEGTLEEFIKTMPSESAETIKSRKSVTTKLYLRTILKVIGIGVALVALALIGGIIASF